MRAGFFQEVVAWFGTAGRQGQSGQTSMLLEPALNLGLKQGVDIMENDPLPSSQPGSGAKGQQPGKRKRSITEWIWMAGLSLAEGKPLMDAFAAS